MVSPARTLAPLSLFAFGGICRRLRPDEFLRRTLPVADNVRAAKDRFKNVAIAVSEGCTPTRL